MARPKGTGWWEEYRCGCVSPTVRYKKDLLSYCPKHGEARRQVFPDYHESWDELMESRGYYTRETPNETKLKHDGKLTNEKH